MELGKEQLESTQIKHKCALLAEINQCEHFITAGCFCSNPCSDDESANKCAFMQPLNSKPIENNQYTRQPRWYEQYYKDKKNE